MKEVDRRHQNRKRSRRSKRPLPPSDKTKDEAPYKTQIEARSSQGSIYNEEFRKKFNVELRNRFEALELEDGINEHCNQIENIYVDSR